MLQSSITSDRFSNNAFANTFVDYIEQHQTELSLEEGILYYEFPIFKEVNGEILFPSFCVVSRTHGVLFVVGDDRSQRTLANIDLEVLYKRSDQLNNFIFSKLLRIPRLKRKGKKNEIIVNLNTCIFLPNYVGECNSEEFDYIETVKSYDEMKTWLDSQKSELIEENDFKLLCAVLDGSYGLPKLKDRNITDENRNSKGGILEELEKEIAIFDQKQKIAALTQIDGPQRIRGLAGSGKTVVLALKAALIHMKNPNARILFTFYTKALYDHIVSLITRFYRMHEDHDPDFKNKIHVRHAWGGKQLPGVYYDACVNNGIQPLTYFQAKNGMIARPFENACKDLLDKTSGKLAKTYDYVLLDEGQDFEPAFYWLCRKIVKNDCLVWAYDELQNILNIEIQNTMTLFANSYGDSGINLEELQEQHPRQNNDIVLHKCYRNPREILTIAHAVGFGVYNDKIVQRLENKEHWEDLGYVVEEGECREDEKTVISRPVTNSPSTISEKQSYTDIVEFKVFSEFQDEVEWICQSIKESLQQHLLPEDIMVICLDDKNAKTYFNSISKCLDELGVKANNILNSYLGDEFVVDGSVTLSTVYRAKGNEAGLVYVVGVDSYTKEEKNNIIFRNKLFTAFTRSKAWLKISGIDFSNSAILDLGKEIESTKNNDYKFIFRYPGESQIKTLRRELADMNHAQNEKRKALLEVMDQLGVSTEDVLELLQTETKNEHKK